MVFETLKLQQKFSAVDPPMAPSRSSNMASGRRASSRLRSDHLLYSIVFVKLYFQRDHLKVCIIYMDTSK